MKVMSVVTVLVLMGAPFVLAGCNDPSVAAAPAQQAPDVGVISVTASSTPIVKELPGRIAPIRVADVRARVSGIVVSRLFEQGSEVKAGDPLYQIDTKPFEVDLQAAEAALAKAEAVLEQTSLQSQRTAALILKQAASQAENEAAIATARQAVADVSARKAEVLRARLHLEYATIRAPINGVIGAALVSEGALVVQNDVVSMATIQQLDRVYADFTQPAAELGRLRRDFASGALEPINGGAKVRLVLEDGAQHSNNGKLLFSDAKVDANTGQVTLRGEFPNMDRDLLPGMYVRVQIEQGIDTDAILVPQQAVQRNGAGGSEVYVLDESNRVLNRPVRVGSIIEGKWQILDGLKAGERVVVEGFQKFAAGDAVRPGAWPQTVTTADVAATQAALR